MWPFTSISSNIHDMVQMMNQVQYLLLLTMWNLSATIMQGIGSAIVSFLPTSVAADLSSRGWFGGSSWANLRTVAFAFVGILFPIQTFLICLLVILHFLWVALVLRFLFFLYHNVPVFGGHK